jgi:hypothetical protein
MLLFNFYYYKKMKILFSICAITASTILLAQPVINNTNNIPAVGASFPAKMASISSSQIGTGGINQTWDLTTFGFSTFSAFTYVDPSTTTLGGSFPTADHCFQVGPYSTYIDVQPDGLYFLAFNVTTSGGTGDFSSDSRKYIQFPYTYGTSFTETYMEQGISKTVDVSYEGYGTLLMPGKTYTNIVRSKEVESGGEIITRFYSVNPLTIIGVHFDSNNTFFWSEVDPSASINELESLIQISPNPASDVISINVTSLLDEVLIYDMKGKEMKRISLTELNSSNGEIDVSDLENGAYIIVSGASNFKFIKK